MIRSIYAKIFLWFWAALLVVTISVMLITIASGSQPLGRRWMSLTFDVYARSAVNVYQNGGKPALERYVSEVQQSSGIEAELFDPQGQNILGRVVPAGDDELLQKARTSGKSQFSWGFRWSGASVVATPQGDFILVARMFPLRGNWRQNTNGVLWMRIAIALLVIALLCMVLARHIAWPIRAMQVAAQKIADGDLTVRTSPVIGPRNDELADLARDFDKMAERIQSLLQRQQGMMGEISHELRSPLTRLNVSLELVRRGDVSGIDRMQGDLDRLDNMVGQILTLTRLQISEGEKVVKNVNLRSIVESVAEDAQFEGQQQGKSVRISHREDCWVKGDPALFRSCIENVVRNAVRYTMPGTEVEIALDLIESSAHVIVRDHGNGVPEESLPHLFEPFYRTSGAQDTGSDGFGLGLTIAQRVVALYGGVISAHNRNGGGLTMEIQLPAMRTGI